MYDPERKRAPGEGPSSSKNSERLEPGTSQAQPRAQVKLHDAARGRQWILNCKGFRGILTLEENGIFRCEWSPKVPKEHTPQGQKVWARYFDWRDGIAQDLANETGREFWFGERMGTGVVFQIFRPD